MKDKRQRLNEAGAVVLTGSMSFRISTMSWMEVRKTEEKEG